MIDLADKVLAHIAEELDTSNLVDPRPIAQDVSGFTWRGMPMLAIVHECDEPDDICVAAAAELVEMLKLEFLDCNPEK